MTRTVLRRKEEGPGVWTWSQKVIGERIFEKEGEQTSEREYSVVTHKTYYKCRIRRRHGLRAGLVTVVQVQEILQSSGQEYFEV